MREMKVGDEIVVTELHPYCSGFNPSPVGKVGTIVDIDYGSKLFRPSHPFLVKYFHDGFGSSFCVWCNGVPATSLMKELV